MENFERDPELAQMSDEELMLALSYFRDRYLKSCRFINNVLDNSISEHIHEMDEVAVDAMFKSHDAIIDICNEIERRRIP